MADNSDLYFTTVTVGQRGQIVIPARIRKELAIHAQEQLVVMSGPHQEAFIVMKADSFIEKQEQFKEVRNHLYR